MHRPGPNTGRAQRASGVRFQVLSAGCVGRVGRCLAGVWVRGRVRRGRVRFRGVGLCEARGRRRPSVERAKFERGLRRLERLESRLHLGVARVRRSTINVVSIGESAYIFAEEAQAVACRVREMLACCVETGGQGQSTATSRCPGDRNSNPTPHRKQIRHDHPSLFYPSTKLNAMRMSSFLHAFEW